MNLYGVKMHACRYKLIDCFSATCQTIATGVYAGIAGLRVFFFFFFFLGGGGGPSSLKFLPGMGLGGCVQFLIYFLEGGGGGAGNLETALVLIATRSVNSQGDIIIFHADHFLIQ